MIAPVVLPDCPLQCPHPAIACSCNRHPECWGQQQGVAGGSKYQQGGRQAQWRSSHQPTQDPTGCSKHQQVRWWAQRSLDQQAISGICVTKLLLGVITRAKQAFVVLLSVDNMLRLRAIACSHHPLHCARVRDGHACQSWVRSVDFSLQRYIRCM